MANLIEKGTKFFGVSHNYVDSKPTPMPKIYGGTIEIPASMEHLWYEAKLAVGIGKKAGDVSESEALVTRLPWLLAKGLDTFTPSSEMISKDTVPDPHNLELWLKVGTPEGIRPVKPGQKITASITGLIDIHFDAVIRSTPVSN
ncbi:putative acylpyruvase FAHD1 mitochondrial [Bienertia sinuspersici]